MTLRLIRTRLELGGWVLAGAGIRVRLRTGRLVIGFMPGGLCSADEGVVIMTTRRSMLLESEPLAWRHQRARDDLCAVFNKEKQSATNRPMRIARLKQGNARFVAGAHPLQPQPQVRSRLTDRLRSQPFSDAWTAAFRLSSVSISASAIFSRSDRGKLRRYRGERAQRPGCRGAPGVASEVLAHAISDGKLS